MRKFLIYPEKNLLFFLKRYNRVKLFIIYNLFSRIRYVFRPIQFVITIVIIKFVF